MDNRIADIYRKRMLKSSIEIHKATQIGIEPSLFDELDIIGHDILLRGEGIDDVWEWSV